MAISHRHQPLVYPDYVNPLPADDIIKIGAVKQDLYDKNYAKIQSHINELDNYGLELVRDVDKKYFSQEMDKYMKAINESVGKTDFANMANVRGILSVSRPLENDPLILNSIKSSQELRRRQKTLSSLKSDERNPANEWVYMQDVYDWKDNPEVGAELEANKQYTPFADPSKYMQDIVGKVKGDIYTQIVKDGRYTETKDIEEVTNRKLKDWMEANLPQQYKQQIMIDALYSAKDVDPAEMANYYFDTRKNQLTQTENTMKRYEALGDRLTPTDVKEYQKLALQRQVLLDNLNNLPQNPQQAYNAWINDHYNSYITNQADLYAYRHEKARLEADPFSLADYNSSLRRSEAYYRDITLEQEQQRLGLGKYSDYEQEAGGTGVPGGEKMTKKEKKEAAETSKMAADTFKEFTNGLTKSSSWEKIDVNRLDSDNQELLIQTLKDAMYLYNDAAKSSIEEPGDGKFYYNNQPYPTKAAAEKAKADAAEKWVGTIPSTIDLEKVSVRLNPADNTYHFRVGVGNVGGKSNVVHEIWQDKFDEAFNKTSGLEDANALNPYSIENRVRMAESQNLEELKKTAENRYNPANIKI